MNIEEQPSLIDMQGSGRSLPVVNSRWRRDRRFFTGMAVAAAVIVFIGFAPTYYLKAVYGTPPLPPLVHLHGLMFTAWFVLLTVQTSLVAAKRTDLHRRLGIGGAILTGFMVVVTFPMAIIAVRLGRSIMDHRILAISLSNILVFLAFVGTALAMRRRPEAHKRLMLIASTVLLTASVGRWRGFYQTWGTLGIYVVSDLFVVTILIYDFMTRWRPHPATIWGGLFLVVSQFSQEMLRTSDTWLAIAKWLTR